MKKTALLLLCIIILLSLAACSNAPGGVTTATEPTLPPLQQSRDVGQLAAWETEFRDTLLTGQWVEVSHDNLRYAISLHKDTKTCSVMIIRRERNKTFPFLTGDANCDYDGEIALYFRSPYTETDSGITCSMKEPYIAIRASTRISPFSRYEMFDNYRKNFKLKEDDPVIRGIMSGEQVTDSCWFVGSFTVKAGISADGFQNITLTPDPESPTVCDTLEFLESGITVTTISNSAMQTVTHYPDGRIQTISKGENSPHTLYEYDDRNLCTQITTKEYPNTVTGKTVYTYDSDGRCLTSIDYNKENVPQTTFEYSYFPNGALKQVKHIAEKGAYTLYAWDENGNCIGIYQLTADADVISSCEYSYHPNGKISLQTERKQDGSRHVYVFREDGNHISYDSYQFNNALLLHVEYTYHENGRLKQVTDRDARGICSILTFDQSGRQTCIKTLSQNGSVIKSEEFRYYDDGTLKQWETRYERGDHTVTDYHPNGKVSKRTILDANGRTEIRVFDENGKEISRTEYNPDGTPVA